MQAWTCDALGQRGTKILWAWKLALAKQSTARSYQTCVKLVEKFYHPKTAMAPQEAARDPQQRLEAF